LIAAAAAVVALTAAAQGARNYYKVGVVTELSGDLARGGNVTKRGYDLWADAVNATGGIQVGNKKYKVQLFYGDAQSLPSGGAAAAERLINQEQVDFILGPFSSGVTLATAPVVEKFKVPMITGSAESPKIWKEKFQYTFGTIPPVNFTGAAAMEALAKLSPAPRTAVVIGSDDTFSKTTATAFNDSLVKLGIKVLKFNIVPEGEELTPMLSAVKSMRPDILAFGGHDSEEINLVKDLRQIDFMPKILIMHYGVTEEAFVDALKADANQVFGASVWLDTTKTASKILWKDSPTYAAAAQKAFGIAPDYTQAGSSAAGIAYQVALQKIKAAPPLSEAQRTDLMKALETVDVDTFYGHIKFATEGEFFHSNVGLNPITIQIQNGQVKAVAPPQLASAKAQYPMTPWNQR
jgi:branched-chain amino acid transport system substrate-binding protein